MQELTLPEPSANTVTCMNSVDQESLTPNRKTVILDHKEGRGDTAENIREEGETAEKTRKGEK